MKCKYKKYYKIYKETIDNLIMSDTIKIEDLPFEIRVLEKQYYIYAFRFARYEYERFVFINDFFNKDYEKMNQKQKRMFSSFYYSAKDDYYVLLEQIKKERLTVNTGYQ